MLCCCLGGSSPHPAPLGLNTVPPSLPYLSNVPSRTRHTYLFQPFACSSSPLCCQLLEDKYLFCCLHCCVPASETEPGT